MNGPLKVDNACLKPESWDQKLRENKWLEKRTPNRGFTCKALPPKLLSQTQHLRVLSLVSRTRAKYWSRKSNPCQSFDCAPFLPSYLTVQKLFFHLDKFREEFCVRLIVLMPQPNSSQTFSLTINNMNYK